MILRRREQTKSNNDDNDDSNVVDGDDDDRKGPSDVDRSKLNRKGKDVAAAMSSSSGGGSVGYPTSSQSDALTRSQRLFSGVLLLVGVDVIWVASSEFTEYIFKDLHYDKPYFSTYFKTSLFVTYLLGFVVYRPWREQCAASADGSAVRRMLRQQRYQRVNDSEEEDILVAEANEVDDEDEDDVEEQAEEASTSNGVRNSSVRRSLSSPTWIPANIPESGKSSGTESENEVAGAARAAAAATASSSSSRRVRFKNVAQVVEMNPAEALHANLARLSYGASLRAQAALRRAASRLTCAEVAQLAVLFSVPWFAGNFCYQTALSDTEAAVVNVLSSSSSLFTLLLAAVFPSESGDRITLSKFLAVCFSVMGVVLVSYSDLDIEGGGFPAGAAWTLAGAFFYSAYIVLLRRKVSHEDNMDSPMFFGFVGLFVVLCFWPGLPLLHLTEIEVFELPTLEQLKFLLVNGLVGTVLSELLWLWGCFYTSSLVATLSLSLTIPLSVLADIVWKGRGYGPTFLAGAVPMFFSFFVVAMLTHYEDWDPVMDAVVAAKDRVRALCCRRRTTGRSGVQGVGGRRSYVFDRQERESLIQQQDPPTMPPPPPPPGFSSGPNASLEEI